MAAEQRALARRAATSGPTPADYTKPDTMASLAMGVGSLLVPLLAERVVRSVVPGKGRFPKVLVRTAVVATIATTVADRLARRQDRAGRVARKVARVGGPVAVATGGLALTTTVADRTKPDRMWERNGGRRDLGEGALGWAAALAGWDFIYYWNHRFMHEVRALWAIHVVHHSSERYNLSTALRQPVADVFGLFVPYGLLARLGVRPGLIAQARGFNLLYQYWIHTDAIRRLGPGEEVLNTPSHHRVHHGSNRRYIDRNHGSILIVWDRLFGTFQPERDDVRIHYGIVRQLGSFNLLWSVFHEWIGMARDLWTAPWRHKLGYLLREPGWSHDGSRDTSAAIRARWAARQNSPAPTDQ